MTAFDRPTRIVILGGGFGGAYTARHLERLCRDRDDVQITLVNRDNYLLMTPLLFEAGSGVLEPRHTVYPLRNLLRRARFVEADVEAVDFERRVVLARPAPGEVYEIPYDQLVLALGGVTPRNILPGAEHAITFKTLADAIFFRNYVIDLFERADVERDPQRKRAMLRFVIIGGGLVGVELMGELTDFVRHLRRSYPRIGGSELRFELIEAGSRLMPEMEPPLVAYAMKVFQRRGVRIRTNCRATGIDLNRVHLPGGETIEAATIVMAAGLGPNPLLAEFPLPKNAKGRIVVEPTMRCAARPEVWAIGDCASIPDPHNKPYPPLAQHALREAKVLAGNILAALNHRPLEPFVYRTLGMLAALGHHKGVGRVWRFRFKGFVAWWIWRTYYLMQMPGWDRRLRIMLDWTIALLFKNDIVKLDLFGRQHPLRRYEQRVLAKTRPEHEVLDGGTDGREAAARR